MEIRIAVSPGERRVAVLVQDRLHLAAVERPSRPDGVGDIHAARVVATSGAMSGAFLSLASGETAFLPEGETPPPRRPIAQVVNEGDLLVVRIARAAQGGKGPRVTMRLEAPEPLQPPGTTPALLRRGDGAALRFAGLLPEAPITTDSAAMAASLRRRLGHARVALTASAAFDAALEDAFEELASPVVELGGGAKLLIYPTPALTAIDVDAGSAAGSVDPAAHMRVNERAAAEVARQIRLRNIGGAILVDFAGLGPRRRAALLTPLAKALEADPLEPKLLGLTRLGLVEIVRRRVHPALHEILGQPPSPMTRLLAALRRAVREAGFSPSRRLAVRAAPEVVAAVPSVADALDEYRAATGRELVLLPDAALRPGQEQIEDAPR
jgi:Ribonuclease G/E